MPFYQLTVPSDSPSAGRKADIAAALTRVHAEVTGAPASFVNVSFVEVPPGSLFVAGEPVSQGRLVEIIRAGRSDETRRDLITGWPGLERGNRGARGRFRAHRRGDARRKHDGRRRDTTRSL